MDESLCSTEKRRYLLRRKQCHASRDPTALTRAQNKDLALDAQRLQNLQVHDSSVPVREVLALCARLAVAQKLDCDQVHGVRELLVAILRAVELGGGREAVDEDEGGFAGVVGFGHLVGGFYASQMGNVDGLGVWHDWDCFTNHELKV